MTITSKTEEKKKELSPEEKRVQQTTFILLFPFFIIGIFAILFIPGSLWWISLIIIALAIYGFLMLKKFVEDYYKRRL
jgi:positive regulator of sigma E activity